MCPFANEQKPVVFKKKIFSWFLKVTDIRWFWLLEIGRSKFVVIRPGASAICCVFSTALLIQSETEENFDRCLPKLASLVSLSNENGFTHFY